MRVLDQGGLDSMQTELGARGWAILDWQRSRELQRVAEGGRFPFVAAHASKIRTFFRMVSHATKE